MIACPGDEDDLFWGGECATTRKKAELGRERRDPPPPMPITSRLRTTTRSMTRSMTRSPAFPFPSSFPLTMMTVMAASAPVAWAEEEGAGSGEQGSGGEEDVVFDVYSLFAVLFLAGIGALMAWRVATYLIGCGCAVEEAENSRTVVRIEKKECNACNA